MSSSRIEGVEFDAATVRSSVARHLGIDIGDWAATNRHIEGIVSVLIDATSEAAEPLTEERLFAWHAALFPTGRSEFRSLRVGAWRGPDADPMQVVSGTVERQRVHFEAPPASRVPEEMRRFLSDFERRDLDPVLAAGIAHLWFETIHPFEDGNGRIGRAIADLALARANGGSVRAYSLSSEIEARRSAYYEALESAQQGGLDITPWLEWFLDCLGGAIARAGTTLETVFARHRVWQRAAEHPLDERQRKVIARLLDDFIGPLTTSKYAKIAKCSQPTALRDVNELVDWGILEQNPGGGRSTSYRLADFERATP